MVTSAPPATADLLYLSSNCSTARQQPEVNTNPTLQHVCLFYHSCKAVWYKVCLTCSWEMMNNTFTHVERKYSKSSINHLKCPTASWIRHVSSCGHVAFSACLFSRLVFSFFHPSVFFSSLIFPSYLSCMRWISPALLPERWPVCLPSTPALHLPH